MIENDNETVLEVCSEIETCADIALKNGGVFFPRDVSSHFERVLSEHEREIAAKDAEINRMKHILKSSCRWIKCHDIYHTSGSDILKEAKEVLHDDGEFLFKKGE